MQFDPTTGKEVTEKAISLSEALEYISQISSIAAVIISIITLVFAVYIYKIWTRDESRKLLISDTNSIKREAYKLAALEISIITKMAQHIKTRKRALDSQSEEDFLYAEKYETAMLKALDDYLETCIMYSSKRKSVTDEMIVNGDKDVLEEEVKDGPRRLFDFYKETSSGKLSSLNQKELERTAREFVEKALAWRKAELEKIIELQKKI